MKHREYLKKLQRDPEYVAAEKKLRSILDLGDDILALRLQKGWSQAELAKRVGTRQANISRLENGLANPTIGLLQKLAGALDTELVVRLKSESAIERTRIVYVHVPLESVVTEETIYMPQERLPQIGLDSQASDTQILERVY